MKFRRNLLFFISTLLIIFTPFIWEVLRTFPLQAQPTILPTYETFAEQSWSAFPRPWVSTDFSSEERAKIWRSLTKAQEVVQKRKGEFYGCVEKYVNLQTMGEYDGTAPGTGAVIFISTYPSSIKRQLYIDRYVSNDRTLGKGQLGITRSSNPDAHFKISLNSATLTSRTENQIAGTIVHEMLHNWGYKHDRYDRSGNDEDRRGNFVYEAGWCVARGGADKQPGSLSITGDNEDEFYVD